MKVLATNWINLLGVFIVVFIYAIILNINDTNVSRNALQAILGALFLVCGYGIMFWGGFIIALVVLDLLIIIPNSKNLKTKLLIEWVIISSPFIYWAVKYSEWIFLAAVFAFLITQMLRGKRITAATH